MKTLTIVVLFIGFLTVNFLLNKGLASLKGKGGVYGLITRYFPVAELLFWSAFVIWAVDALFSTSQFYMYIIFLLITLGFILIYLLFIRDYIVGVQLKSRYNLSSGQRFKSGQISGIIKRIELLFIQIKGDDGTDFKVPYSQIDQKAIEIDFQDSSGGESLITIELDRNIDEDETAKKIAELVINSRWCSHKSIPKINIIKAESGPTSYEVSCILVGEQAARNLKELIEKYFSIGSNLLT